MDSTVRGCNVSPASKREIELAATLASLATSRIPSCSAARAIRDCAGVIGTMLRFEIDAPIGMCVNRSVAIMKDSLEVRHARAKARQETCVRTRPRSKANGASHAGHGG